MRKTRLFFLISGIFCLFACVIISIIYLLTLGVVIALIGGISFLILYFIYPLLTKTGRKMVICLLIILGIYLVTMLSIIGKHGLKNTTTFTEDFVLVLGSGLKGEELLPTLKYRLDKCLEYMQHNPGALILVSGGQGKRETIRESEAMKRYLVANGVNEHQIKEERQSKNTRQNMQFSKTILDNQVPSGNYSVVCITSDFHAYRANKLAKKAGLNVNHFNSKTVWYIYPTAYIRETFSVIKMWLGY